MLAFALRADGWYLRADIVWSKPNPMPESVTDRPTKSHEYVFLLTRSPRYYFDAYAVREPHSPDGRAVSTRTVGNGSHANYQEFGHDEGRERWPNGGRNIRSVWEIPTQPFSEAHFATYPQALVERCVKAGCPEWVCGTCGKPRERIVERGELVPTDDRNRKTFVQPKYREGGDVDDAGSSLASGGFKSGHRYEVETTGWSDCGHNNYQPGVVLDPFLGSGTTALVARRLGRRSVGIELNPEYADMAAGRLSQLSLLA